MALQLGTLEFGYKSYFVVGLGAKVVELRTT
jgi:hypothetical protein